MIEFRTFTDEQIKELLKEQKVLDDEIRAKNDIPMEKDLTMQKYIALKTELFELTNQIESFNFWKKHKGKDKILEEGVDVLHFILSMALDAELDVTYENNEQVVKVFQDTLDDLKNYDEEYIINESIVVIDTLLTSIVETNQKECLLPVLILLTIILQICGYSIDDMYNAYIHKNEINHKRQEENY